MILDKGVRMAEGIVGFQRTFLLVFVTLCTTDLLSGYQSLGVRSGQARYGLHLGTGRKYNHQPGQSQDW
jgi:hypothetical protein